MDKDKQVTIREQIEWMLDKIEEEDRTGRLLAMVDTVINRVYVTGRP